MGKVVYGIARHTRPNIDQRYILEVQQVITCGLSTFIVLTECIIAFVHKLIQVVIAFQYYNG